MYYWPWAIVTIKNYNNSNIVNRRLHTRVELHPNTHTAHECTVAFPDIMDLALNKHTQRWQLIHHHDVQWVYLPMGYGFIAFTLSTQLSQTGNANTDAENAEQTICNNNKFLPQPGVRFSLAHPA